MQARRPVRRRATQPQSPVSIKLQSEPLYDALGNALRQDIFNGVSHSHIQSLNTSSYTDDIPAKSTETYPPKFGVQRNADSKYWRPISITQSVVDFICQKDDVSLFTQ